jgi:hypothetical protein
MRCQLHYAQFGLRVVIVVSNVLYRLFYKSAITSRAPGSYQGLSSYPQLCWGSLIVNESISFEFLTTLVNAGNLYYRPRYQVKPVNPNQDVPKWVFS